jgi:hypothetical protein
MAPLMAVAQRPVLLRTFNNPTPATGDNFAAWLSALGSDRVVIGAPYDDTAATNAGAVYLFHTNGTLLRTITNPAPAYTSLGGLVNGDQFGSALATLGTDRIVVASPFNDGPSVIYAGTVFLFNTNGALLTTITNPNAFGPDKFGASVATLGTDRILISAVDYEYEPDIDQVGIAYLFNTNGALLATFENPNREGYDQFGFSLAALGNDRVLIGTASTGFGVAYLFNTNGTILTSFTNPTPAYLDYFGHSVAACGSDRIVVGAPWDDTGAEDAGSVYIFATNGTLLTTITNPTPGATDSFGNRLSAVGIDRVLVGSPREDAGAADGAGAAYVFSHTGTLLITLTNPAPATGDLFASRLVAVDNEHVLIGAMQDNSGATDAGAAYFFSIPPPTPAPSLTIRRTLTNSIVLSWPLSATNFVLQQNTNALGAASWSNVTAGIQNVGTNKTLTVTATGGSRFYRLVSP